MGKISEARGVLTAYFFLLGGLPEVRVSAAVVGLFYPWNNSAEGVPSKQLEWFECKNL